MALTYVGGTSASATTGSTYVVSLTNLSGGSGSQPEAGDLVIVVSGWASNSDGAPGVTTAGYAELKELYANSTRDANFSFSYKVMTATPDTSVTVTGRNSSSYGSVAVIHVWRGCDPVMPFDASIQVSASTTIINSNNIVFGNGISYFYPYIVGSIPVYGYIGGTDTTPSVKSTPSYATNAVQKSKAGTSSGCIGVIFTGASVVTVTGSWANTSGSMWGGESASGDSACSYMNWIRPAHRRRVHVSSR